MRDSSSVAPPRPVIEDIRPRVDDGRYDAKGVVGDPVQVSADAFADGHDLLRVELCYRHCGERNWQQVRMQAVGNDRWQGAFTPTRIGRYQFQLRARIDAFETFRHDLAARVAAGQDVTAELAVGAAIVEASAANAGAAPARRLRAIAERIASGTAEDVAALDPGDADLVVRYAPGAVATSARYGVRADRVRARFSTWYEMFPRSAATKAGRHGTFLDVVDRLGYLRDLGIDVLYLPPIHPIGTTNRKGRNGSVKARAGDVGSPWAIGAADGGHTAIHPRLGTFDEFHKLVEAARDGGIEVALDLAFQCSPDHPWVTEHPEWFRHSPDGSIRFAENPPKKYEDIYPLDFETEQWRPLWEALREVVEFWIGHGVTIFRVDNPHTKSFAFWEWLIPAVQEDHEDVIFLAEAFTRPKVMQRLAKLGFTQSYTYFAWRRQKWEIEQYLDELTNTEVADYFRPNFWPNTPDILTEQLQHGDSRTFALRALLAGTLAANYGIYGPVYELAERRPRHEGSEEYLDGEKYEIRHFDVGATDSLAPYLARLNAVRHRQVALQHDRTIRFHPIDNDALVAYSKTVPGQQPEVPAADEFAPVLVIANLDDRYRQSGWVSLDLAALGLGGASSYVVHDLLTGARYQWSGPHNFVILDPDVTPGHLFRVEPAGGAVQ